MATSMGTTQFMNAKLAAEKPIFTRAKINHVPPHPVTHLIASNRRIILVLANKTIQRVDQTRSEDNLEVIDISKMIPKAKVKTGKTVKTYQKSRFQLICLFSAISRDLFNL